MDLETVEKLKENSDIDLILMDVQMPEMNGYEAIKRNLEKCVMLSSQHNLHLSFTGDRGKSQFLAGSNDCYY
jgi:CheY-like chemotaxis protein